MNFKEQIQIYFGCFPVDRIQITQLDQIEITKIDQAVIFVFATWSSSSVASFKLLLGASEQWPQATFPIYVVDTDTIDPDAFISSFGKRISGNGETIWIKNGGVLHVDLGYTDKANQLLQHKSVLQDRISSLISPEDNEGNV